MIDIPICIGDIITFKTYKNADEEISQKALIYKVVSENHFKVFAFIDDIPIEGLHPWGGDMARESIGSVIDHWEDAERIIRALEEGRKLVGSHRTETLYQQIREDMKHASHKEIV